MGDKDEGGVKNLKKWVTSFMDGRLCWYVLSIGLVRRSVERETLSIIVEVVGWLFGLDWVVVLCKVLQPTLE